MSLETLKTRVDYLGGDSLNRIKQQKLTENNVNIKGRYPRGAGIASIHFSGFEELMLFLFICHGFFFYLLISFFLRIKASPYLYIGAKL